MGNGSIQINHIGTADVWNRPFSFKKVYAYSKLDSPKITRPPTPQVISREVIDINQWAIDAESYESDKKEVILQLQRHQQDIALLSKDEVEMEFFEGQVITHDPEASLVCTAIPGDASQRQYGTFELTAITKSDLEALDKIGDETREGFGDGEVTMEDINAFIASQNQ